MKTHTALITAQATFLGLLLSLSGCSGGGSGSASTGPMYIEACSLGCGSASGGSLVTCGLVNVSQNAEVTIRFSQPVDLSSVTSASFRLINRDNGTVPEGVFTLSSNNPRVLIFRPSLSFTGEGIPEFGFEANAPYELSIQGADQGGGGPFIRSTGGRANTTLMNCTILTTEPLIDPVPGSPTGTAYITSTFDPNTGAVIFDPTTNLPLGELLEGAKDVPLVSRIVLIFDDIMNKSTVANQLTGTSTTLGITRENATGASSLQDGRWDVTVDFQNLLRTVAVFTPTTNTIDPVTNLPDQSFLSGGSDSGNVLSHTLNMSSQIQDVIGNTITNPGQISFEVVTATFVEEVLGEDFTDNNNEDKTASGGVWGNGRLTHGLGGGSGRLGLLRLRSGDVLTLNTDSQTFPLPSETNYGGQVYSIMGNIDPDAYDEADSTTWPTVTIDTPGQAFEFSHVRIDDGARLVLTGARPGRIFSRGNLLVNGVLDLSGETPSVHESNTGTSNPNGSNELDWTSSALGGDGGDAGPNGGAGGQGADRMDVTDLESSMEFVGGISWDSDPELAPLTAFNNGRPGIGVGGIVDGGTPFATGGVGGVHWPSDLPETNQSQSPNFGNAQTDNMEVIPSENCRVVQVAGAGSGGSHARDGETGISVSNPYGDPDFPTFVGATNAPSPTPGGQNFSLELEAPGSPAHVLNKRNLEFWRKNLNGGSGGGGGGTSLYGSKNNLSNEGDLCNNGNWILFPFWDHSGAGGGGGGGSVMLVAGRDLTVMGLIDCSGGDGGSSTQQGGGPLDCTTAGTSSADPIPDCGTFAAPGGGGAGGSIRLQGATVTLDTADIRLDVRGGQGGLGAGGSVGGAGSPGLVRIEHGSFTDQPSEAAAYAPGIAPFGTDLDTPFTSAVILSVGDWRPPAGNGFTTYPEFRPEAYSGSQSCWMATTATPGSSGLEFVGDEATNPNNDPALYGWNMDIVFDVPGEGEMIFPYRGLPQDDATDAYDEVVFNSTVAPLLGVGVDFQTYLGSTLNHSESVPSNGSYLVIRFQGVVSVTGVDDPCTLNLQGPSVLPNSITPYVSHPDMLNGFPERANMVRFAVTFDESLLEHQPDVERRIAGVTNVRIRVQPE